MSPEARCPFRHRQLRLATAQEKLKKELVAMGGLEPPTPAL